MRSKSRFAVTTCLAAFSIAALVVFIVVRKDRASQQASQTVPGLQSLPSGQQPAPVALSLTLVGNSSSLAGRKKQQLQDIAAQTFAAYSAGSFTRVWDAVSLIRNEIPTAWDPSQDFERADAELAWFFGSFNIAAGPAEVVAHVSNGRVFPTDDDRLVRNGTNIARGTHKEGLSVFNEPKSMVPRDEYEVILPYTHTGKDGSNQSGRFGVRFLWSDVQKRWVQIGVANYGFKVGQTIPMIPY
jgi:hypothetical protein